MNRQQKIISRLQTLQPTILELEDTSAAHAGHAGTSQGAGHFHLTIQSPQFEGKSKVQCHQLVYQALGDLIGPDIHAISIKIEK